MLKRWWSIIALTLLVVGCFFAPLPAGFAAEDTSHAEEQTDPQGAGVVILMIGLGAIVVVGGAYMTRQTDPAT